MSTPLRCGSKTLSKNTVKSHRPILAFLRWASCPHPQQTDPTSSSTQSMTSVIGRPVGIHTSGDAEDGRFG